MNFKTRLINYSVLALFAFLIPYLVIWLLIIFTGDRIEGMKNGITPSIMLVHFFFGMIFISKKQPLKFVISSVLALLITALVILFIKQDVNLDFGVDQYGFFDLSLVNLVIGLLIWEIYFLIDNKLK